MIDRLPPPPMPLFGKTARMAVADDPRGDTGGKRAAASFAALVAQSGDDGAKVTVGTPDPQPVEATPVFLEEPARVEAARVTRPAFVDITDRQNEPTDLVIAAITVAPMPKPQAATTEQVQTVDTGSSVVAASVASPPIRRATMPLGYADPSIRQPEAPLATGTNLPNADKSPSPDKISAAAFGDREPVQTPVSAIATPAIATGAPVAKQPVTVTPTIDPAAKVALAPREVATGIPRAIRITLRPQELGDVQVTVRNEAGQMRVTIVAETEAGHAALSARGETLNALVRDIRAVVPTDGPGAQSQIGQQGSEHAASAHRQPPEQRRSPKPITPDARGHATQDDRSSEPHTRYVNTYI